jgi:DNA-binding transcriptional regulator YiaG
MAQIVTLREKMDQQEVDEALGRESAPSEIDPEQVKKLRDRFSLTQAELAELLGVSAASVTSWESGKTHPGRENRRAIADLRETDPAEISRRVGREEAVVVASRGPVKTDLSPQEVKDIREEVGLTQRELAEKLGVSANSISNWETGRSVPRRRNIQKLMALRDRAG